MHIIYVDLLAWAALTTAGFDIDARFNSKPMGGWYFGTDACPSDQFSFVL